MIATIAAIRFAVQSYCPAKYHLFVGILLLAVASILAISYVGYSEFYALVRLHREYFAPTTLEASTALVAVSFGVTHLVGAALASFFGCYSNTQRIAYR